MAEEPKVCGSCGMPMRKPKHHGGGEVGNPYCVYCADETGKLKSHQEVREGMIHLCMAQMGKSRDEAEKFVDEEMGKLPAWKDK
jgi:putative hemolysin